MSLSTLSIKRPVLTIVMNLSIVLFGIIGYTYLGVREFPSIDPAQISVRTNYSGANADIIESQITEPLEKAINSIDGIRNITSSSNQGSSNISIEFNLDKNLESSKIQPDNFYEYTADNCYRHNPLIDETYNYKLVPASDMTKPAYVQPEEFSSDKIVSVFRDFQNKLKNTKNKMIRKVRVLAFMPSQYSSYQNWIDNDKSTKQYYDFYQYYKLDYKEPQSSKSVQKMKISKPFFSKMARYSKIEEIIEANQDISPHPPTKNETLVKEWANKIRIRHQQYDDNIIYGEHNQKWKCKRCKVQNTLSVKICNCKKDTLDKFTIRARRRLELVIPH